MEETTPDDQPPGAAEPEEAAASTSVGLNGSPSSPSSLPVARIRQTRHVRSGSFQKWCTQMQRAWRWGPGTGGSGNYGREQSLRAMVNFEMMVNQKRQWYQIKAKTRDYRQIKEPTSLYEHFFIVGLHSYANCEAIEDAFAKRKIWESEVAKSEILDNRRTQYNGCIPTMEPQILFNYPPGKRAAMRENEVPAFCFPEGVKARLIERTPSMSDLNEVVFGQEACFLEFYCSCDIFMNHNLDILFKSYLKDHLSRDDLAFIFCLKASDNAPLYGVCMHVQEIVQRAPGILDSVAPLPHSPCKPCRFLASAPRCYCLLTRLPFFELHYEMLNSIIAQERLDRITHFVSEMDLAESTSLGVTCPDQLSGNSYSQQLNGWTGYAIPVDTVSGLISSSVFPMEREMPSFPNISLEPHYPESASISETSDFSHLRELDKENKRAGKNCDDNISETSGSRSDSFEMLNGCFENGHTLPEVGTVCSVGGRLRAQSLQTLYSSVRDMASDDDDEDGLISKNETHVGDEKVMGWAKTHNNEPLQIVCGYHALPLPPRGGEIIFHPLEHLQPIKYSRPDVSSLGLDCTFTDTVSSSPKVANEIKLFIKVNARLAAAEEALALSIWTTTTICRALSLESILSLFTGALLEKQVIVICPNLGMLSAIVLSIIPMIRPFQWHSLLLPILPRKMQDFLDAPVPYIVGIPRKPTDIKMKTANLIRINVYKDEVKACSMPQLPGYTELIAELEPIHATLACENSLAKRNPVYKCSEVQTEAAEQFLDAIGCYLESLCANLRSHTLTNVQSNNDKVSLLLKDSFIDSFPVNNQPFIKLFVETQMFSVLSDSRLSRYENE